MSLAELEAMKKLYILIDRDSNPELAVIETTHEANVIRIPENSKLRIYGADEVKSDSKTMARILMLFGSRALNEVLEDRAFYVEIGLKQSEDNCRKLRSWIKRAFISLSYRRMRQ